MGTTLLQLRTLARERAEMENDQNITDSMLTSWINQALEELYDRVVAAFADHWFTTADFTLTGGTVAGSQYTLAGGFRYMRALEHNPSTTNRHMVPRWTFGEKDRLDVPSYRLLGGVLQIEPFEYAAGAYRLYYIPNPTLLNLSNDVLDAKLETFREYIVVVAAIKARIRQESDVRELREDLARIAARIDVMAKNRDAASAARVNDVERVWYPGSGGGGGGQFQ